MKPIFKLRSTFASSIKHKLNFKIRLSGNKLLRTIKAKNKGKL